MFKLNPIAQQIFEGFLQRIVSIDRQPEGGFIPNPNFIHSANDAFFYEFLNRLPNFMNQTSTAIEIGASDLTTPEGNLFSNFSPWSIRPGGFQGSTGIYLQSYPSDDPHEQTFFSGSIRQNPRRRFAVHMVGQTSFDSTTDDPPWRGTHSVTANVNQDMIINSRPRPDLSVTTAIECVLPLNTPGIIHTLNSPNTADDANGDLASYNFEVDSNVIPVGRVTSQFSDELTLPYCDFMDLRRWVFFLRDRTTGELVDCYLPRRLNSFNWTPILIYDVNNPSGNKRVAIEFQRLVPTNSQFLIPSQYVRIDGAINNLDLVCTFYANSQVCNVVATDDTPFFVSDGQARVWNYGVDADNNDFVSSSGFIPNTDNHAVLDSYVSTINAQTVDYMSALRSQVAQEALEIQTQSDGNTFEQSGAFLGRSFNALNLVRFRRYQNSTTRIGVTPISRMGGVPHRFVIRREGAPATQPDGTPTPVTIGTYTLKMFYDSPSQLTVYLHHSTTIYRGQYGFLQWRSNFNANAELNLGTAPDGNRYYIKRLRFTPSGQWSPLENQEIKRPMQLHATIVDSTLSVVDAEVLIWEGDLSIQGGLLRFISSQTDANTLTGVDPIIREVAGVPAGWIEVLERDYIYDDPSLPGHSYVIAAWSGIANIEPPSVQP